MKAFGRSGQVIGKANIDYQLWHLHYTTIMPPWSKQMRIPYANAQAMDHKTTIAGKKSNTMQTRICKHECRRSIPVRDYAHRGDANQDIVCCALVEE
jgi:hypothetical protein